MFKLDLRQNEKALTFFRQSETTLIKPVAVILVLIYAPWFFLFKYELLFGAILKFLLFWTIGLFFYGLSRYLLWLASVSIITNQRLIIVTYPGLLKKQVLETPLNRILNVSFSRNGFFQTVFGLGTVEVRAEGLNEPMKLSLMANPSGVKDAIWQRATKSNVR